VSLGWILIFLDFVVVSSLSYGAFTAINVLVSAMFFYFIDASVLDGRMSDPLLRDTLHWRRIRRWLWAIFAATSVISISLAVYYEIATGGNGSLVPLWVLNGGDSLHVFVVIPTALIALPITAARSRDPFLRRQLAWFAGFAAALAVGGIFSNYLGLPNELATLSEGMGQLVGAFCLYKSARSLTPLNRISLEEATSK